MLDAALVMRDRESDSWWAIMKGRAIGGELEGTALTELPLGEKTTWGRWVEKHPETLVLSVEGMQYDESKPYANYFASDGTFRGMQVEDQRLPPKEAIYGFPRGGRVFAVVNAEVENGLLLEPSDESERRLFFYRQQGLSLFGSTLALELPADLLRRTADGWEFERAGGRVQIPDGSSIDESQEPLQQLVAAEGVRRLEGFDTFWYTWVAAHPDTELLR